MLQKIIPNEDDTYTLGTITYTLFPCDVREINNAFVAVNKIIVEFMMCWNRVRKSAEESQKGPRSINARLLRQVPRDIMAVILHFILMPPYMVARTRMTSYPRKISFILATRSYMELLVMKKSSYETQEERKIRNDNKNKGAIARAENKKQKWKYKK